MRSPRSGRGRRPAEQSSMQDRSASSRRFGLMIRLWNSRLECRKRRHATSLALLQLPQGRCLRATFSCGIRDRSPAVAPTRCLLFRRIRRGSLRSPTLSPELRERAPPPVATRLRECSSKLHANFFRVIPTAPGNAADRSVDPGPLRPFSPRGGRRSAARSFARSARAPGQPPGRFVARKNRPLFSARAPAERVLRVGS